MSGDDKMLQDSTPEVWRAINAFPNYAVSDCGQVKRIVTSGHSKAGKVLKPFPNSQGYLRVRLYADGVTSQQFIHRLVLETFTSMALPFMEVNHKDGNYSNNHLANLEWVTAQENAFHSFDVLGRKCLGRQRLTDQQAEEIRQLYQVGYTQTHLAQLYGVSQTTIWRIVRYYRRATLAMATRPSPVGRRVTPEQATEIRTLYAAHHTLESLAEKYQFSVTTIWRIVHRYRQIDH